MNTSDANDRSKVAHVESIDKASNDIPVKSNVINLDLIASNWLLKLGYKNPRCEQILLMRELISTPVLPVGNVLLFDRRLAAREAECLMLAAQGKSVAQTAKALNIAKSTVRTFRKRINLKLNCKTTAQAVFEGILRVNVTKSE